MKKILISLILLFSTGHIYSQWQNLNTGINDVLTGISFNGNKGLASGENGIYITTNCGNGANSWSRYTVSQSSSDYQIYENTVFKHAIANNNSGSDPDIVYACDQNTLNNTAVFFRFDLNSVSHQIIYQVASNSILKKMAFDNSRSHVHAEVNNGLLVLINNVTTTAKQVYIGDPSNTVQSDFTAIGYWDNFIIYLGSEDKLYSGGSGFNNNGALYAHEINLVETNINALECSDPFKKLCSRK